MDFTLLFISLACFWKTSKNYNRQSKIFINMSAPSVVYHFEI